MNGFDSARLVETRAMTVLLPFLEEKAYRGRVVICLKGAMSRFLQETAGDLLINFTSDEVVPVEIKAEQEHTGNLFLETWSNRNLEDRYRHAERGSNPGWMWKLRSGLLFYYFLDCDKLYVGSIFRLKTWFFGHQQRGHARFEQFPEVVQRKTEQLNDTWGRLVSVVTLQKETGLKLYFPKQLELFDKGRAA